MLTMIDIMENEVLGPAIRKGLVQGERNVVVRLLTWKFGPLPGYVAEKLQSAAESDLLVWEQRLLNANTLDEIFHP